MSAITTKEEILKAVNQCLEEKGKRKFTQSVELIVNFKGIDFSKQENRLNIEVSFPEGRGKEIKTVVFANEPLASEARKAGANLVITGDEILNYDKKKIKELTKNSVFLAQPQLMITIGKNFGQILGSKGKLPTVVTKDIASAVNNAKNTIKIKSKGKYLPTIHCPVGSEKMTPESITENIFSVLSALKEKVGDAAFRSIFIKLSMSKPVKLSGS